MDSGSSASEDLSVEYKVLFLGNGLVGKTSIIRRCCEDSFTQNYKQTIGLDFYMKKLDSPSLQHVTLQIWDIGGQQLGGSMIANYIRGAHAVCFVYDVTNSGSFKDISEWHHCVITALDGDSEQLPLMVLVGNKTDLPNVQISESVHERVAAARRMESFLLSARSGEMVNVLFTKIAAKLSGVNVTQHELDLTNHVVANVKSVPKKNAPVLQSTQIVAKTDPSVEECSVM